jgi:hypothetical protein
VVLHFLNQGIRADEKNSLGVCAKDLIYKNPELSAIYTQWERSKSPMKYAIVT